MCMPALHAVDLLPARVRCRACGHDGPWQIQQGCEACGSKSGGEYTFQPNPHNPEHRRLAVGDNVHCNRCADFPASLAELRRLDRSTLAHSRYRSWCGQGAFYVYRRDPKSPSGVKLAMTIEARPEAEEILCQMRLGPLSPTEGL